MRSPVLIGLMLTLLSSANHRDLLDALDLGDRLLRHQERVRPDVADEAHAAVLPGTEHVVRIRKHASQTDRAGLDVDLPIGREESAFVGCAVPSASNSSSSKLLLRAGPRGGRGIALHERRGTAAR